MKFTLTASDATAKAVQLVERGGGEINDVETLREVCRLLKERGIHGEFEKVDVGGGGRPLLVAYSDKIIRQMVAEGGTEPLPRRFIRQSKAWCFMLQGSDRVRVIEFQKHISQIDAEKWISGKYPGKKITLWPHYLTRSIQTINAEEELSKVG